MNRFIELLNQTSLSEAAKQQLPVQISRKTKRLLVQLGNTDAETVLNHVISQIDCGSTKTLDDLVNEEIRYLTKDNRDNKRGKS